MVTTPTRSGSGPTAPGCSASAQLTAEPAHADPARRFHWVVITGRTGEGQYTFNDPGDGSAGNSFVWDGQKLHQPTPNKDHAEYLYVVAWIRPNKESLAAWNAHWAQKQAGGAGAASAGGATPAGGPAAGAK